MAQNRCIGVGNKLPWDLPEDMAYFREKTRGKPVVMGRKTYESIGRLLPERPNIIVTREPDYQVEGAHVVQSLEAGLEHGKTLAKEVGAAEVMVIGGAQIYTQAMPVADRLYLTEVAQKAEGDAFFPEFNLDEWQEVSRHKKGWGDFVVREKISRQEGLATNDSSTPQTPKKLDLFPEVVPDEGADPFPPVGESLTEDPRTEARLCAMQAVYRHLLMGDDAATIADDFKRHELTARQADKEIFESIWQEYTTGQERFLEVIAAHLNEKWTLDRLPLVEKSLLLAAIAELYACPQTPVPVMVNEYVNLAKGFLEDNHAKFINGLLDAVAKKVR